MNPTNSQDDVSVGENVVKSDHAFTTVPGKRVIIHLDVDCFYVQLWMRHKHPELVGKDVPIVVANSDKILSVNYTAKSLGVKREDGRQSLVEARLLCKQAGMKLVEIFPGERFGKIDTFLPQTESDLILDAIFSYAKKQKHSPSMPITVERNGNDEFYIDVTQFLDEDEIAYYSKNSDPNDMCALSQNAILSLNRLKIHPNGKYNGTPTTVMEGRKGKIIGDNFSYRVLEVYPRRVADSHMNEFRLVQGAILANAFIKHIKKETGYDVSAGVGHSKLVAKLACGRNKPNGITVVTDVSFCRLRKIIPFRDLPGYGRKLGQDIQNFLFESLGKRVNFIADLLRSTNRGLDLIAIFKKLKVRSPVTKSSEFQNMCQFKDDSVVIPKIYNEKFGTSFSLPFGFNNIEDFTERADVFHRENMNICLDMTNRIKYYRSRGRHATEVVIKADMIQNPTALPRGRANRVLIPVEDTVLPYFDNFISEYVDQNNLNYGEITKIHLTAGNIIAC